jgi:hypothetical protein
MEPYSYRQLDINRRDRSRERTSWHPGHGVAPVIGPVLRLMEEREGIRPHQDCGHDHRTEHHNDAVARHNATPRHALAVAPRLLYGDDVSMNDAKMSGKTEPS